MKTIPNFIIPKNLYKDLTSIATWRHHTLSEEIRERITISLSSSYLYNRTSELSERIRLGSIRQYLSQPTMKFLFHSSNLTDQTFTQLRKQTGYNDTALVNEIVARLAYTMNDPFYYEFIENNKRTGTNP